MARKKTETKTAVKSTRKVSSRTAAAAKSVKKGSVKKAAETTEAKAAPKAAAATPKADAAPKATAVRKTTKVATKKTPKTSKPTAESVDSAVAAADAPLSGEALLKKVKELGSMSKEEKAKVCGYSATTKSGNERVNLMKFYNALLEAEDIDLDGKKSDANGRGGGRSASYRITVQSNGNLLIGAAYTKQMDLKPGDEFQITLGRKHIKLTQLDGDSAAED